MPPRLFVVATPIGNLEDVTMRALRVLREADLIAAEDTRRTAHLLTRYGITARTVSLHDFNERQRTPALIRHLREGGRIALVCDSGTPTVSDPGFHLIREAIAEGIAVEVVPGPSAVLTALAGAGLPIDNFTFMGFAPNRLNDRNKWLRRLASTPHTVVIFEAPHRIRRTLQEILEISGDRPICLGRELTKIHEELVRGPISQVLAQLKKPRGEYTVVIGPQEVTAPSSLERPTDQILVDEFGEITENNKLSRRQAVSALASRHSLPSRTVYQALERAKCLSHDQ